MTKQTTQTPFDGFPPAAFDFYAQLGQDNSKSYWSANSTTYEKSVKAPMAALLAELAPEFGAGKVFRPYRDVRFSPDKRPYKEHQGGYVESSTKCGYYVQVDADSLLIGGGWYAGSPEQVTRYRQSVLGPHGPALAGIVAELTAAGFEVGGELLKSQPRGVPADHPLVELLRHRTMTVQQTFDAQEPWVSSPEALERVRQLWRTTTPLLRWLGEHATDPASATD